VLERQKKVEKNRYLPKMDRVWIGFGAAFARRGREAKGMKGEWDITNQPIN
jgi:hypothetical protein